MSDYISRQEAIDRLSEALSSEAEFEIAKQVIIEAPTVDEKEIIRKTVERIVERLEEEQSRWKYDLNVPISRTINKAIEIIKEECGISE